MGKGRMTDRIQRWWAVAGTFAIFFEFVAPATLDQLFAKQLLEPLPRTTISPTDKPSSRRIQQDSENYGCGTKENKTIHGSCGICLITAVEFTVPSPHFLLTSDSH